MAALLLCGTRRVRWSRQLGRDLMPLACLLAPLLLVNTVPWLNQLTSRQWVLQVRLVPIHQITLTPFFSAYLYLYLALGVGLVIFKGVPRKPVLSRASARGGEPSRPWGCSGPWARSSPIRVTPRALAV